METKGVENVGRVFGLSCTGSVRLVEARPTPLLMVHRFGEFWSISRSLAGSSPALPRPYRGYFAGRVQGQGRYADASAGLISLLVA